MVLKIQTPGARSEKKIVLYVYISGFLLFVFFIRVLRLISTTKPKCHLPATLVTRKQAVKLQSRQLNAITEPRKRAMQLQNHVGEMKIQPHGLREEFPSGTIREFLEWISPSLLNTPY